MLYKKSLIIIIAVVSSSILYLYGLLSREPVENIKHVFRDMAKFRYANALAQSTSREASIERAAVVQPVCNEGMHKGGGCRWSKRTSDSAELTQLIEAVATQKVIMSGKS